MQRISAELMEWSVTCCQYRVESNRAELSYIGPGWSGVLFHLMVQYVTPKTKKFVAIMWTRLSRSPSNCHSQSHHHVLQVITWSHRNDLVSVTSDTSVHIDSPSTAVLTDYCCQYQPFTDRTLPQDRSTFVHLQNKSTREKSCQWILGHFDLKNSDSWQN